MILYIDHYDSFTNIIVDYIEYLGYEVCIKKTDKEIDDVVKYSHIVIGPGPGYPNALIDKYSVLIEYCAQNNIPLLGICLGHQLIAQYYGSNIIKAKQIYHGRISKITKLNNSMLYKNHADSFYVTRYNSLIVDQVFDPLVLVAVTDDKEIMAFEHKYAKIFGVQYHPEAYLTEYGLETLKNFLVI